MDTDTVKPVKEEEEASAIDNGAQDAATSSLLSFPPNSSKRSKKDDRSVAALLKALNEYPTMEERLTIMCQKHVMAAEENKKLHFYIKQSDKRHNLLTKEKLQLQLEFNKVMLVKGKLENLCRELQKQNKLVKEESAQRINEMNKVRKETQNKFQTTLSEISVMLQQDNEKNAKLHDENINMNDKFKSILEEYKLREQQVEKMGQQMALEQQLSDAKLQKALLEHQADRETLLAEMEKLKMIAAQYKAEVIDLKCIETSLRGQLAVYTDKYDEFQNALVKSNQVFGGFKGEMEKMSNKIKSLEKESLSWKQRWEISQVSLINSSNSKHVAEVELVKAHKQLDQLQKLCRTLQAERTVLYNTLKEHQIERPPIPVTQNTSATSDSDNVDALTVKCAKIRDSLAYFQNHFNVITNQEQEQDAENTGVNAETGKPKKKVKRNKRKGDKANENDINLNDRKPDDVKRDLEQLETDNTDLDIVDQIIAMNDIVPEEVEEAGNAQINEETIIDEVNIMDQLKEEFHADTTDMMEEGGAKVEANIIDVITEKLESGGTEIKEEVSAKDKVDKEFINKKDIKFGDIKVKKELCTKDEGNMVVIIGDIKSDDNKVEETICGKDKENTVVVIKEDIKSGNTEVKEELCAVEEVKLDIPKVRFSDTEVKALNTVKEVPLESSSIEVKSHDMNKELNAGTSDMIKEVDIKDSDNTDVLVQEIIEELMAGDFNLKLQGEVENVQSNTETEKVGVIKEKSNTGEELKAGSTETKAQSKGKKKNKKGKDLKCGNGDSKTKNLDTSNDEISEILEVKSILNDSGTTC